MVDPRIDRSHALSGPWWFFIITLGWSYLLWLPIVLRLLSLQELAGTLLFALGGLSPALAGLGLTYATRGRAGLRDTWRRIIEPGRIPGVWYLVILSFAPLANALAITTALWLGTSAPSFERAGELLANPLTILPLALFVLFFGPVPEELGWRGYALDALQRRGTALAASLILGAFWSAWHLPMFFMEGSYIASVFPWGTPAFWLGFLPGILAGSVAYTWVYNHTRRSILAAILFHFVENLTGEFLVMREELVVYRGAWLTLLAIAIVAIWGPRALARTR